MSPDSAYRVLDLPGDGGVRKLRSLDSYKSVGILPIAIDG